MDCTLHRVLTRHESANGRAESRSCALSDVACDACPLSFLVHRNSPAAVVDTDRKEPDNPAPGNQG